MGELRVQVVQLLGDRDTTAVLAPAGIPGAGFRVNGARVRGHLCADQLSVREVDAVDRAQSLQESDRDRRGGR